MLTFSRDVASSLVGVACAVGFVAISAPAFGQAADPEAGVSVRVPYADLNLATAAGAGAMVKRIDAAAREACGGEPDVKELKRTRIYEQCRGQTVARAVANLNAPLVTALANQAPPVQLSRR